MPLVYAVREDNGERVLVEIQCDRCDATIKPDQYTSESGWVKHTRQHHSETLEWWYCPDCDLYTSSRH